MGKIDTGPFDFSGKKRERVKVKKDTTPGVDEVEKLIERLNTTEKPKGNDLALYRKALAEVPGLWKIAGDLVEQNFLHLITSGELVYAMRESLKVGQEEQRRELGYENAGAMERALIDHVLLCKLRLEICEYKYTSLQKESMTFAKAEYWERKLSATQRRYLRSCETLAKVRKLMRNDPTLQVNIAAPGGQQVNIAGDLVRPVEAKQEGEESERT